MNALADRLRSSWSRRGPGAVPDISDGRVTLGGPELIKVAEDLAPAVKELAGSPAPMVAVVLPLSTDALVMLVAAILGDYSVCFIDPAGPAERREQVLAGVMPDIVADSDGLRRPPGCSPAGPATHVGDERGPTGYVAMSSGSLGGGAKAVLSPWSSIDSFAPHGADALGLTRHSTWAELSHPSYDMAMTNILLALASGAALRVSAALGDRVRPLRFIDRVGGTHVRVAPRFVDLATAERHDGPGSLRVWGSGGDRLYASHVERLFSLGVPAVVNTYGTSESIGFASAARLERGEVVTALNGTVTIGSGGVGPWRTLVVELEGQSMLAIETPHLPGGYLFGRGGEYPRWHAPDTLLTGDAGTQLDGEVFCLGRSGRRVKRHGRFVDLDEVDAALHTHRAVASYTLVTADGELLALVEAAPEQAQQIHRGLPAVLRSEVLPDRLVPVRQLPRLGNGKIDQVAAREMAALDRPRG